MKNTLEQFNIFMLFSVFAFCFITSCAKTAAIKPTPEDFSLEVRENLGAVLNDAILNNPEAFSILDRTEYEDNVYYYLQKIMKQVSNLYHFNNTGDGWSQDKKWEAYVVVNDNEKFAFCIPGGNFFISTGFLKSIKSDYELYYVMAFELTLMNERILLEKLWQTHGIENIDAISNGTVENGGLTANEVAFSLIREVSYDVAEVREIDQLTIPYICETSDFNQFGIIDLINNQADISDPWFITRPSYSNRINELYFMDFTDGVEGCGTKKNIGKFESFVLAFLP